MENDNREMETLRALAVRRDFARDGKVGVSIRMLTDDDTPTGEERFYPASAFRARPGNIYEFRGVVGTTAFLPNTVKYLKPWSDENGRVQMDAEARAFDAALDADRLARKELSQNILATQLAPVRELWISARSRERTALEILVLRYLRTGSTEG